ncbi:AlbA family DNA-binding domain-containing protein [Oceanivirga salmonicida]|uniref:AlbA family DNA-binding domain-containing protein n=1 Tax=Oceanivirga salmonicida TaxID=1769291 RepID=UPI0018CC6004|nr:RNA-binding domain-containing protein [Oceanivirga salmonicida]
MKLNKYIGETNLYDKKEKVERNKPKSWLKSVSAFANYDGGKLIFGVLENNEIKGLENYKSDSEFISQKIKEKIEPIPEFDIEIKEIDNKIIIILDIFEGAHTPYYYNDSGTRTAYRRVGNETVVVNSIE